MITLYSLVVELEEKKEKFNDHTSSFVLEAFFYSNSSHTFLAVK
jgi:hypothetical protein